MSFSIRDGKFDIVVAQGPNAFPWPTIGARALASLCAEMGLKVGVFGGDSIQVRGLIPRPGTGALVIAEDVQGRFHRVEARAVVKICPAGYLPDAFPGWWRDGGMLPLPTAKRLLREGRLNWDPGVVVLGTGNKALRFASSLLERGVRSVYAVETIAAWGAKRYAGWEVEYRRFEMLGGKILEAEPKGLEPLGALRWQLRLQDERGVRLMEVGRVVSAGPFSDSYAIREYPGGSLLFEFEQSAEETPERDFEGWVLEDERGRYLAGRLIRALVPDLGARKEDLDAVLRRARARIRRYSQHREKPFAPAYQGKWLSSTDSATVRKFSGTPKVHFRKREVASVECFEEIACDRCARACPTQAINIGKVPRPLDLPVLREELCTGCGICLEVCPSQSIVMMKEPENHPMATLVFPWRGRHTWKQGEFAPLVNRRGDFLANGRVIGFIELEGSLLIRVEVPSHLAWDARALRAPKDDPAADATIVEPATDPKVEITFNGERRLVRPDVPVSLALFELGYARPQDTLLCPDGSCQLCRVWIDGIRKLGCQTTVHRGMAIRTDDMVGDVPMEFTSAQSNEEVLCPCLGIKVDEARERIQQGKLTSLAAVCQLTRIGSGRCHGQICREPTRRLLSEQLGSDVSDSDRESVKRWVDWRFPWADWVLSRR